MPSRYLVSAGVPAKVQIFDANGDKLITAVTPFPSFEGTPSVCDGGRERRHGA